MKEISRVELKLPSGRQAVADLATPSTLPVGGVVLIHEWWGLNDEMRALALKFADHGFLALAVDLFEGSSTDDPSRARELMNGVSAAEATETMVAWVNWLRVEPGCNGRVGTLGYCFGGGWSLNASLATPVDATVIYYGNVRKTAKELATLKGPVLGHFGRLDQAMPQEMAEGFAAALTQSGKTGRVLFYDADHAFSRVGGPNFDARSAALAEQRTLDFLHEHLD